MTLRMSLPPDRHSVPRVLQELRIAEQKKKKANAESFWVMPTLTPRSQKKIVSAFPASPASINETALKLRSASDEELQLQSAERPQTESKQKASEDARVPVEGNTQEAGLVADASTTQAVELVTDRGITREEAEKMAPSCTGIIHDEPELVIDEHQKHSHDAVLHMRSSLKSHIHDAAPMRESLTLLVEEHDHEKAPGHEENTSSMAADLLKREKAQAEHRREKSLRKSQTIFMAMEVQCLVVFTYQERTVLSKYFEMHDVDHSHSLSISELLVVIDDMERLPKAGSEDEFAMNWLFTNADQDGSGELDFSEFLELMEKFYHTVYFRIFHDHDADNSGSLSTSELNDVLEELTKVGFCADAKEAHRLFDSADHDGDGHLDFPEFCSLLEKYRLLEFRHLERSASFTESTLHFIELLFHTADEDGSGCLDLQEIVFLLDKTHVGQPIKDKETLDLFVSIFARVDKDNSATLDLPEFLRLLRVWQKLWDRGPALESPPESRRSSKQQNWEKPINPDSEKWGQFRNLALQHRSVMKVKSEQMYYDMVSETKPGHALHKAETTMMAESAENIILSKNLSFAENGQLLSIAEIAALRENFAFSDADGNGKISSLDSELTVLLKHCGFEPTTHLQKKCLKICIDRLPHHGVELDFAQVAQLIVEFFKECADTVFGIHAFLGGSIPPDMLPLAFYELGQYISPAKIHQIMRDAGVDVETCERIDEDTFLNMLAMLRIQRLSEWRTTYDFKDFQIQHFKEVYQQNCEHHQTKIKYDRLDEVLAMLGYNWHSEENESLLERFDVSQEGKDEVSWESFLLLMKHLESKKEKQTAHDMHEVAKELGFNETNYIEVQELFQHYDIHGTGVIKKNDVRSLFHTLANSQAQRKILREALEDFPSEGLDFTQFLHIIHKLDASGNF